MEFFWKRENRNALQARNSFVTRKAEEKMDVLAGVFKSAARERFVGEQRDTLQRTLKFEGFLYFENLKLVYNWENRFFAVNYNLQMLSDINVNHRFADIGSCSFDMQYSMKRHSNDRFVCRKWQNEDTEGCERYLERLNNPLIIDRIHDLDIYRVAINYRPEWRYFRISMESIIGSGTWILIPPVMQLITPQKSECIRFMELYELLGDALVNNKNNNNKGGKIYE
ncbi:MAG: hypothetical protein IJS61_04420 [Firmicutes bacterium]|nr:hypothetical protein [Bacillota bacterium]